MEDARANSVKPTKPTFIVYSPTSITNIKQNSSLKIETVTKTTEAKFKEYLRTTVKPTKPTFVVYSPTPTSNVPKKNHSLELDGVKTSIGSKAAHPTKATFINFSGFKTNTSKNEFVTAKTSLAKLNVSKSATSSTTVPTTRTPIFKMFSTSQMSVVKDSKPSNVIGSNSTEMTRGSGVIGSKINSSESSIGFNLIEMIQGLSVNQSVQEVGLFDEMASVDSKTFNSTEEDKTTRTLDSSSNFFQTISSFLLKEQETEISLSNENQKLKFVLTKDKVLNFLRLFSGLKFENR